MTTCTNSICALGGDGQCCHECYYRPGCVSPWMCESREFYAECLAEDGGICLECGWQLAPGKSATYTTSCGKTMMASDPPEEGEECLNCGKPIAVKTAGEVC